MDVVDRHRVGACATPKAEEARRDLLKPVLSAGLAAVALAGFYLGVIALAQDWAHARNQLAADRWFVGAISTGFGLQVGLFVYLRALHARSNPGAIAASTGTSSVAMLACCAHHLADALPLIGLSGAAVFLNDFRGPILWGGVVMNGAGVAYLAFKIRQQGGHLLGKFAGGHAAGLRYEGPERS